MRHRTLDPRCPAERGEKARAPVANRLVPTLVPRQLLGGARVGRCHGLALAFTMGTHERLGASSAAAGGVGEGGGRGFLSLKQLTIVKLSRAVSPIRSGISCS